MKVCLTQEANVEITIRDGSEAVVRITGTSGDEWRREFYPLYTEEDVFNMWADNAIRNGVEDVNRLEGWGDLDNGEVTVRVQSSEISSFSVEA